MLDIGWSEIAVIAVVALIVIGPKDLPRALHTLGKWVRKARMLAREFQSNVDEMVRQSELDDLRKQVEQARSFNLSQQVEKTVDPDGKLRDSMTIANPMADSPAAQASPAQAAQPAPAPASLGVYDAPGTGTVVPMTPPPSAEPVPVSQPVEPSSAEKRG